MDRAAINPVTWSLQLGFDQAELIEGHRRLMVCSGQDAVNADGEPQHPGDMAAQLRMAVENLKATLTAAAMTPANIIRCNVYTTDMAELLKHWSVLTASLGTSGGGWTTSLLGVSQLAAPQLLVLLEATAVG